MPLSYQTKNFLATVELPGSLHVRRERRRGHHHLAGRTGKLQLPQADMGPTVYFCTIKLQHLIWIWKHMDFLKTKMLKSYLKHLFNPAAMCQIICRI